MNQVLTLQLPAQTDTNIQTNQTQTSDLQTYKEEVESDPQNEHKL